MKNSSQVQGQIKSFLDRKTKQFPELDEIAEAFSRK